MKLPVIIVCAVILICFLPASGLDLSHFPDLQAKYPGLGTETPRTTFDELKDNFVDQAPVQEALLQKIGNGSGSRVGPVLPDTVKADRMPVSMATSSYNDMIAKHLQDLTDLYAGSSRSFSDLKNIPRTLPDKKLPAYIPATSDVGKMVVEANNQFALDLYSELARENPGENLFFAPWSISSALAISYEGARGTNADEIRSVFHFPDDDMTRWNGFSEITGGLNSGNSGYVLKNANALWAEETYPFLHSYITTAERYYSAHVTNLDFITRPDESRKTINRWVEEKTENRIQDLLPPDSIDSETRLVITNAIYFKGTWATQFKKENTAEDNFRVSPTTTVRVPMMKRTDASAKYWYAETATVQVLGMPYAHQGGRELSMLVILPRDDDLAAAEQLLDPGKLSELRQSLVYKQIMVYFPKFKLEAGYQLRDTLSEMGMPSAFIPGQADFSGMDGSTSLVISDVFHKTFVEVNEEGTEAAAATAVPHSMGASDPGIITIPVFRADHPFIFLIQDSENGNILFMGRVMKPVQ
jgi:serpin B